MGENFRENRRWLILENKFGQKPKLLLVLCLKLDFYYENAKFSLIE